MSAESLQAHSEIPGVSVVIPAYNYARFLPGAIESVLNQTYPRFELIVVNDGSTDETAEVVARYGGRVRYIYQENAGLSAARNTGIRAAEFPFVSFLDADDEFAPDLLDRIMSVFASLPPNFGLVSCRELQIDANGDFRPQKSLDLGGDWEITIRDVLLKTRFPACGLVVRREVFEQCGYFDTSLRSSEDRDMWIRIAVCWRLHQVAEPLVRIRQHAQSMSKNGDRMKENMRQVIRKAYAARVVPRTAIVFWLQVISFFHYQTAWMYHDMKRHPAALRDLLTSMILWPFFAKNRTLNEPALFRLRSLRRFLAAPFKREEALPPASASPVSQAQN
jgi:glycosyltransferase involved in cell wall biosynthesis